MGFVPMAALLGCVVLMWLARKKAEAGVQLLDRTELQQVAAVLSQTRRAVFVPSIVLVVFGAAAYFILRIELETVALAAIITVAILTGFANYRTRAQVAKLDLPETYQKSLFVRHLLELGAMVILILAIGATALNLI